MTTATLGGLIKDYRIKKRLSQLEVSLKIGWKDSTRLSKIEQGRAGKPTRKTTDKIIAALGLTNQEKGEFLLAGSYLPTDKEIDQAIKSIGKQIMTWPYAAYLIDFSWRMLLVNQHAIDLFGFPQSYLRGVRKVNFNLLEGVTRKFPNETFKGNYRKDLKPMDSTLISQFKSEHLGKENEKWYKQLIKRYSTNPTFNTLWNTISANDHHEKLSEYEYVLKKWPDGKTVTHHVFESKLVSDKRFTVVLQLREK